MLGGFLIFLGGGLGAVCRWLFANGVTALTRDTAVARFPLGVLCCNLVGCLLIGALTGYAAGRMTPSWFLPLLVTGFLGGFTTFSAFGNDTRVLFAENLNWLALLNIVTSTLGGIAFAMIGYRLTARI